MNHSTKVTGKQAAKKTRMELLDEAKGQSKRMSELYLIAGITKRGLRMQNCGKLVMVGKCARCGQTHGIRIERACYMRLCAICAARRSRIIAAQGLEALRWIDENCREQYIPYMLTLTQKNVPDGQLAKEIGKLLGAMAKLRHKRKIERQLLGYARTIEVTHNHKKKSWHPHVHMIMLLRKDGLPASRLAQRREWESIWADIMGLEYEPEITIKRLTDSEGAVYEVSKYCTKFKELLKSVNDEYGAEIIRELDEAIHERNLQAWGGEWRKARRVLKQKDPENMSEEEMGESEKGCPTCGGEIVNTLMEWAGMKYQKMEIDY